ncbi:MAG TPA: aminomethyltransferase family protein [Steroidobacteraceae bacterium]|nr:aminomethyltransferase family protein [Steroidobacteraceae bacterium]
MLARDHFHRAVCETPFHARTAALNQLNLWHRWRDHTVADAYFDVGMEYNAIRNSCAVFDLSPMTKHLITGPDALSYMNRLVTRDVAKIKPGRVGYCLWCDDAGQVIDDGTIFHLREGAYRLCSQERQLDWLLCSALGFDVKIAEETNEVAGLAVQGPTSCAVLRQLGLEGIESMTPFGLRTYRFEGAELMVSRTGYTGDLGYEMWIAPDRAVPLWDRLFSAGRDHGIRAIGTLALEMSRIEAGFIQAGVDFLPADRAVRADRTRSPFELDLGRMVDFSKPNFTGRRALLAEQQRGSRYRLVRLDVEGNKPAKDAYVYDPQRKNIGVVTSSMWSPAAKASIALASVRMPWGKSGEELFAEIYYQKELKWSRFMARCRVVEGAFYDPARRRLTPAPDQ